MKTSNKIKRWPPLRSHFLDWNLDTKLTPCFHPPVVNTERERMYDMPQNFFLANDTLYLEMHICYHTLRVKLSRQHIRSSH